MAEESWGRVADDGTVFVRTKDGERAVGQWPDANPEEALAFYTRRYDALAFEVDLLEKRVQAGTVSPDDARAAVKKVSTAIDEAQAVGDLDGLRTRLEALTPLVAQQREKKKAERAAKVEEAREAKTKIATEAETIAAGTDWRHGVTRLRELLDEWKALPRLDKSSDDELWHRFSSARTTYTRHRKQHFAELSSKRDEAAVVKERLAAEAETLSASTDWGPTSGRFRDLMRQWKAAGPAPREVDDKLWARFRSAQDAFFGARDAVQAEENEEQVANQAAKEALLVEIEGDPAGRGRRRSPASSCASCWTAGTRSARSHATRCAPSTPASARSSKRSSRPRTRSGTAATPRPEPAPKPRSSNSSPSSPTWKNKPPNTRPRATPARPPKPARP